MLNEQHDEKTAPALDFPDGIADGLCDGYAAVERGETGYVEITSGGSICFGTARRVGGFPADVWYGVRRRYTVCDGPAVVDVDAIRNALATGALGQAAVRLVAGFTVARDPQGNNVGVLDEDADAAEDEFSAALHAFEARGMTAWKEDIWLEKSTDEDLGVTSDTTDDALLVLAEEIAADALREDVFVSSFGVFLELKARRDAAAQIADAPETLYELYDLLKSGRVWKGAPMSDGEVAYWEGLPTWGPDLRCDDGGIWSWDDTHLIFGTCVGDIKIEPRTDHEHGE